MPQFAKQSTRPLTPAGIKARAKRMRTLLDIIERYSDATEIRERQQLTRAIHGLSYSARALSEQNRKRVSA